MRTVTLAMYRVWFGHESFADALAKRQFELDGARNLVRALSGWLALSHFASVTGTFQATATSAQPAAPRGSP